MHSNVVLWFILSLYMLTLKVRTIPKQSVAMDIITVPADTAIVTHRCLHIGDSSPDAKNAFSITYNTYKIIINMEIYT